MGIKKLEDRSQVKYVEVQIIRISNSFLCFVLFFENNMMVETTGVVFNQDTSESSA